MKGITPPRAFKASVTKDFLADCEFIFRIKNKKIKGFTLNLGSIREFSILNMLIIYKIISYSVHNKCFESPRYADTNEVAFIAMQRYDIAALRENNFVVIEGVIPA